MYDLDLRLLEQSRAAPQPNGHLYLAQAESFSTIASRDGSLYVRPVTQDDTALLADLIAGLSDRARWLRFFRPLSDAMLIEREAARVTQRAPQLGTALVATTHERGRVCAVALAELAQDPAAPATADLAVLVRDDFQRAGVGTQLLRQLIEIAPRRGVRALRATLWAENQAARRLLRNLGLAHRMAISSGELTFWAELP
jgi:GNAT superfamily N-acetyltransferase